MPLSTARPGPLLLACAVCGLAGCGWRFGPPATGPLDPGEFRGATVEPGLRAALRRGVSDALRLRGVAPGGPAISGEIVAFEQRPDAVGGPDRTLGYVAEMTLVATVDGRTGCSVRASGRRAWSGTTPVAASQARERAVAALASEVASRAVDRILGDPACR